jgi:FKBP-type peptidyl-prolyl cis-trans isomerase
MHRKVLLLIALAAACGDRTPAPDNTAIPADTAPSAPPLHTVQFAPELGVNLDSMAVMTDGVFMQTLRNGTGAVAENGRSVTVEYKAWLPDGTLFDQRPSPEGFGNAEFMMGVSPPVPGLGAGMTGMRVGEVRRIVIPGEQSFGLVGRPEGVPANSPVVFEVRLVNVR